MESATVHHKEKWFYDLHLLHVWLFFKCFLTVKMWNAKLVPVKTFNKDELMLLFVFQVPSTLNSVTSILQVMLECFDFSPYTAQFQQRLKCKATSPQPFSLGLFLSARWHPNAVLARCFQLLTLRSTGPRRETRFWETCRPFCPWWWSVWRFTWRVVMPLQKLRDWPWWASWMWCLPTWLWRTLSRQPWLCWSNPLAGSSNTQPVRHRCPASSCLERCVCLTQMSSKPNYFWIDQLWSGAGHCKAKTGLFFLCFFPILIYHYYQSSVFLRLNLTPWTCEKSHQIFAHRLEIMHNGFY